MLLASLPLSPSPSCLHHCFCHLQNCCYGYFSHCRLCLHFLHHLCCSCCLCCHLHLCCCHCQFHNFVVVAVFSLPVTSLPPSSFPPPLPLSSSSCHHSCLCCCCNYLHSLCCLHRSCCLHHHCHHHCLIIVCIATIKSPSLLPPSSSPFMPSPSCRFCHYHCHIHPLASIVRVSSIVRGDVAAATYCHMWLLWQYSTLFSCGSGNNLEQRIFMLAIYEYSTVLIHLYL